MPKESASKSPSELRVLAIHAHPDDVEFQCAGTLALLKQLGCQITIATMTPGDCGSDELGPDEIAAVRRAEARRSAQLLGAAYVCLEFRDLQIDINTDARRRVVEALRRTRPDIIFTAPPVDYMTDHEHTSRLVRDAAFIASIRNYATHEWDPAPPLDHIPYLYYVDPVEGVDWFGQRIEPHFYVDITDMFELKRQMLACHESQRAWLLKQHGIDEYLNAQEQWSAQRGSEVGVKYAEAFRQHVGHPYPKDNILSRLLGSRVRVRTQ